MKDDESALGEVRVVASSSEEVRRSVSMEQKIEQWFRELREPVYRYLRSCGGSAPQSEDIAQETFVRLYKQLYRGAIPEVRPWIFRVAHNLLIDEGRKEMGSVLFDSSLSEKSSQDFSDPALNPEQQLLARERLEQLQQRVAELSELQRQALFLRAEGLRYREIGDVLDLSISTVVDAVRRAVKKLGSNLNE